MTTLPILITTGEPAGIGMDIVLLLAMQGKLANIPLLIAADADALAERLRLLQDQQPKLDSTITATMTTQVMFNVIDASISTSTDRIIDNLALRHSNTNPQISESIGINIANFDPFTIHHYGNDSFKNSQAPTITLNVIDIKTAKPVTVGELCEDNAAMVLAQLELAHRLATDKKVAAIVTAPLQKSVIMTQLPDFMGHTEYFMQLCGLDKVVMMLANDTMKVALVTTHLPLRAVADAITAGAVADTVSIVWQDFAQKFAVPHPRILVCGLNPHAGEQGHLGSEEMTIINPVLQSFRDKGVDISLAMPADTLFTPQQLQQADVVIAMYHDQGLAPLKSHGFGETVNITLGLPYIRTSVDHGTALSLAGTGLANPNSLLAAIKTAQQMAKRQHINQGKDCETPDLK